MTPEQEAKLRAEAREVAAAAPPLTAEQRRNLAESLGSVVEDAPALRKAAA